jgi:hypothetical protein
MIAAPLVPLIQCFVDDISTYNAATILDSNKPTETCDFLKYQTQKFSEMDECDPSGSHAAQEACKPYGHGLFSIEAVDEPSKYEWDALIDKVVWRGSDYEFLQPWYGSNAKNNSFYFLEQIVQARDESEKLTTIQNLLSGDEIGPRLRAVLLSLTNPDLVNARFFKWHAPEETLEARQREHWGQILHVDASERMTEETTALYKYQIDIGGGGGTTWSGLIPKLSMPGVLLHHETATKDSYFNTLKPWVHYIPVAEDLSDLQERVAWARANPHDARQISASASTWVRDFRKLRTLLEYNYDHLAKPLVRVFADGSRPLEFALPRAAAADGGVA